MPQVLGSARRNLSLVFAMALLLVGLTMLTSATTARAAWPTGVDLVSGTSTGGSPYQAAVGSQYPDVSADGRYAVFFSADGGLDPSAPQGGIFRKNLQDDAAPIEVVAKLLPLVSGVQCGVSSNASISANGRYVAFATGEDGLVPSDTNGFRDVFVRDMSKVPGEPGAYELVSAPDGTATEATYDRPTDPSVSTGPSLPPQPQVPVTQSCRFGADLPRQTNAAISADGSRVLFTNSAPTNLAGDSGNDTAPGQLFVRDRSTGAGQTTLVTRVNFDIGWNDDEPDPSLDVGDPLPDPEYFDYGDNDYTERPAPFASLSADGTTVAWMGVMPRVQTDYHNTGEDLSFSTAGGSHAYTLLWRRIADGPAAPTRRVTAWVDLDDSACNQNLPDYEPWLSPSTPAEQACAGPLEDDFEIGAGEVDPTRYTPRLSASGYEVFFVTDRKLRTDASRNVSQFDAYMSDMSPGVSRKAGFKPITKAIGQLWDVGGSTIVSVEVSSNGRRAAIKTSRRDFSNTLTESGPFPVSQSFATMFVVDRGSASSFVNASIEWVARPPGSVDPSAPVGQSFALDHDGDTLVLTSASSNLYPGHNGVEQALCVRESGNPCFASVAGPAAPVITSPADGSATGDTTPQISGTAPASALIEVSADGEAVCADTASAGGAWSCESKVLADGAYELTATATVDYVSSAPSSPPIGIVVDASIANDTDPPVVTISTPAHGSNTSDSTPQIAFAIVEAHPDVTECRVDGGAWFACASGDSLAALADGSHTLDVRHTDLAGNVGLASVTFTVDTASPPPPPPPPPPASEPAAQMDIQVAKATANGSATIPVSVNKAGAISAVGMAKLPKGKKLTNQKAGSASASATGSGTVTLSFKLNAAAKKQLKKKRKLVVNVTVTFVSGSGETVAKTIKLTFKSKAKK